MLDGHKKIKIFYIESYENKKKPESNIFLDTPYILKSTG